MFTRKKKAMVIAIYIISFIVLVSLFGESGFFAKRILDEERQSLIFQEDRKRADIALLRSEIARKEDRDSSGELIYVFSDDERSVSENNDEILLIHDFKPLPVFAIFFISFIPAIVFIIFVVFSEIRRERRNDECNNN